ncbi:S41 family peptidase [Pelotomaculum isophthalicicum JI]|uniref:S41 family peptidase n=1 Tax=Pelotomaculum isophthalicicum JI TaxID=947010 RepID=A0A9X4JW68_9FIRM|nr:S41 family peptidase [Pelotomaculum isophthalicicum]MDF9408578.1 S41 family peptidase [Pelotomaculum isophthalicicum JI]
MRKLSLVFTFVLFVIFCFAGPVLAGENTAIGTETFEEILNNIQSQHISNPNSDTLIQGAIDGMINTLNDPYTVYLSPEQLKEFQGSLESEYVGVGMQLQPGEHFPEVIGVIENTPAEEAGIKVNDQIIKVDGTDVIDEPLGMIVQKIRGPKGTKVRLTVRRSGAGDFELELVRMSIDTPTVIWKVLDDGTGYIGLNKFGVNTADEFDKALTKLKQQGVTALILDVRDNPGGILGEAVRIASDFVESGQLVTSTVDKNGERQEYHTKGAAIGLGIRTVVLIDRNSASASEILAGALQDYHAATLIGGTTYGKGTVQTIIPLKSGGALKLTIAKYLTPKDRVVNGIGLNPDYQVLTPGLQLIAAQRFLKPSEKNVVEFDIEKSEAQVNGIPVKIEQTVMQKNGVTYLPLRFSFEALGYKVDWQSSSNSVRITGYGSNALFSAENGQAVVNGKETTGLDPLKIEEGATYIPLSDLNVFNISCKTEESNLSLEKMSASGN